MDIKSFFAPLGPQYCDYFWILSIFFFVVFLFTAFMVLTKCFSKKGMKLTDCFILLTQPLMLYFINRLYYSMCVGSIA